jgi:hypothetical protein
MQVNDNLNQSGKPNPEDSQGCCPSASGGGGCCSAASGSGREKWRVVVFIVVLAAAGIVLAQSLARKSDAAAEQPPQAFPTIAAPETAGTTAQANAPVKEQTADATEPALWGPELDSLAALDEVATDVDTVFILICAQDQQDTQTMIGEIEAAIKKIRSRGNMASAFRLKNDAVDYENIAEQFSVPTVLAMVKGLGFSAVSEQITEANLLEAFVTASRAQAACCPPGTDPSQCAP